jgi:hypothetical protein
VGLSYLGITGNLLPLHPGGQLQRGRAGLHDPVHHLPRADPSERFHARGGGQFHCLSRLPFFGRAALRYSGAAMALNYALNALAESADSETYARRGPPAAGAQGRLRRRGALLGAV